MLKDLARRFLYSSGLLSLYHRLRNADSLTVVTFHRTLCENDPRWATCDLDYTMPRDAFAQSLTFFRQHYNVVSMAQVLAARRGAATLPARALLVTFDDGWADNVEYALPELRAADVPGAVFVVADAVGRGQPFWQEQLIAAWRAGALRLRDVASAAGVADMSGDETMADMRHLIEHIEVLPAAERDAVLGGFAAVLDDGVRHMVGPEELSALHRNGVHLGLHGKSHERLTTAGDTHAELEGARGILRDALRQADAQWHEPALSTMSFPHGAFDDRIVRLAFDAGYELMFTSVPVLNPVRPAPGGLLGRTGFEASGVLDAHRRFRPDWLAWYLFRRPVRRLTA